jgi:2-C-methyl-D-erythritol 4-phosphate cytidylyltransferase
MSGAQLLKSVFVILAAGEGTRFSKTTPKILANILGKSVILRTLESVISVDLIDEILIVTSPRNLAEVEEVASGIDCAKPIRTILGGSTRGESTLKALRAVSESDVEAKILIHDAVRPFVSKRIIEDCLRALDRFYACDVTIPSADTIIEHHDGLLHSIPDRNKLHRGQTPQGFILSKILAAYEMAHEINELNYTDDCSVFMKRFPDEKIFLVNGEETNIKITTFSDLIHAESIIGMESFLDLDSETLHDGKLVNKNAVVFGASSGIGRVLYLELLKLGVPTMGASRSLSNTDVSNPEDVRSFLAKASEALGPISLVFNCAGEVVRGGLSEVSDREIKGVLRTNIMGVTTVLRESLPVIQNNNGSVTLISSSSATQGRRDQAIYAASKAAVESITQSFEERGDSPGVRINAVRPSRTATLRRLNVFGSENPEKLLCPRFVAMAMIRVSISNYRGQVFPVSRYEQDEIWPHCDECDSQTHA